MMGGMIHKALCSGKGGGIISALSITQNGTYNAADYGCDGFEPVLVNVAVPEPVIQSKTITKNGTYTAPEGVDGYSPVIVKNPYEDLYKLEHGGGGKIDPGIDDEEGNPIIINGEEVDNLDALNDLINAATIAGAPVEVAVSDGTNIIKLKLELIYTVKNNSKYVDPMMTMENMRNGQSHSIPPSFPYYNYYTSGYSVKSFKISTITTTYASDDLTVVQKSTGYLFGGGDSIQYSKIGITKMNTKKLKYYILGGV